MQKSDGLVWKMSTHVCTTYEVTVINHVPRSTAYTFDIYY